MNNCSQQAGAEQRSAYTKTQISLHLTDRVWFGLVWLALVWFGVVLFSMLHVKLYLEFYEPRYLEKYFGKRPTKVLRTKPLSLAIYLCKTAKVYIVSSLFVNKF